MAFEKKSAEEVAKLEGAELIKYRREELADEQETFKKGVEEMVTKLTTEAKSGWEAEVAKLKSENARLQKHNEDFLLLMDAQLEKSKRETPNKTALKTWFDSEDRKNKLEKGGNMERITLKAAELMSIAAVGAGSAHITTANGFSINVNNFIDPTIYSAPKNRNIFLERVTVKTAEGTEKIWWSERNNEEGDAEFLAEGGTKPLIDANWQTFSANMFEVAERWKFTTRLMMHAASVVENFQTHARQLIELKIDDEVFGGNGVAPNMSGISDQASAFVVPTGLANFYPFVNIWDVIMAIKTQIEIANFTPTSVVLNTVWMAKMYGIKTETEALYIKHPLMTPDGRSMAGMTIFYTNKIDADHILVGDLSKFNVLFGENIMFKEGYENDDFSKNLVSRKLEAFLGTYIPSTDVPAIVYDEIATIEAAIADTTS